MLKVFASTESWQEKINCENKRAVPLMGASDGIRSSHVCAALRCPHLRQTHVVLISCIWTHSFTLRLHLFLPPKAPLVSLRSSHQSRLCCCSCCSDSHLPFFHNTSFPFTFLISFANIFSASFHLFFPSSSFQPSPFPAAFSLLNTSAVCVLAIQSTWKSLNGIPTGRLHLCHCRMFDLPLTSHCFERLTSKKHLPPLQRNAMCVSVDGFAS